MKKKRSESSAQGKRAGRNVKPIPDSQIDFSDIPEATDAQLKRMRRVGRPASTGSRWANARIFESLIRIMEISSTRNPAARSI